MPGIFISYRRADSDGWAGRLRDALHVRFGDRVFQDVGSIADGEIFSEVIDRALQACDVALVIIGPNWATASDRGGRRLHQPDDWVRTETSLVLNRKIRVIPVLVGGASMPRPEDLPEELRSLTQRQAREIRSNSWDSDVALLTNHLRQIVGAPRKRPVWAYVLASVLVIAGVGVFAGTKYFSEDSLEERPVLSPVAPIKPADGASAQSGVAQATRPNGAHVTPATKAPIEAPVQPSSPTAALIPASPPLPSPASAPSSKLPETVANTPEKAAAKAPERALAKAPRAEPVPPPKLATAPAPARQIPKKAATPAPAHERANTTAAPAPAAHATAPAAEPRKVAAAPVQPVAAAAPSSAPATRAATPGLPLAEEPATPLSAPAAPQPPVPEAAPAPATAAPPVKVARAAITLPNRPAAARELMIGDSWTYRLREVQFDKNLATVTHEIGGGDKRGITELVRAGEKKAADDADAGTQRRLSLEPRIYERQINHGARLVEFAPFMAAFSDLKPGIQWNKIGGATSTDSMNEWRFRGKVAGRERVRVPAGSFDAIKAELEGNLDLSFPSSRDPFNETAASYQTYSIWFVPEVGRAVKYERRTYNRGHRLLDHEQYELVSYQLK